MRSHSEYPSRSHPQKANKHTGIYRSRKVKCPTPKTMVIQITLDVGRATQLQDMYPDVSLRIALQNYLKENLHGTTTKMS